MRQEPQLSDLDTLDEPTLSGRAAVNQPQVIKRGMGFFAWLLLLIALGGVGGLGYWNLTFQGTTQSQGQDQSLQLGDLERRFDELNEKLAASEVALKQQQAISAELQERLDIISGQGISGNAQAIEQVEVSIRQVATATQRQSARLDALLEDLGQSKDQDQNLAQRLAVVSSEQSNLDTRLTGIVARLDGQTERLDSQDERIATMPSLVTANEVQIERLFADLQRLIGQVTLVDDRLGRLSDQVRDLPEPQAPVNVDRLELDMAIVQEQLGQQVTALREVNERLRAIDQFRAQANQAIFQLEDAVRAGQ